MSLRAGDLVRLERSHAIDGYVWPDLGLVIRVRPCEFAGSEFKRICRVTWLRTKRSHEYVEDQLVKV